MHIKETSLIFNEILKAEKPIGLLYGFKGTLDYSLTQIITRFLVYDFVIGK